MKGSGGASPCFPSPYELTINAFLIETMTRQEIEAAKTSKGGWRKEQLVAWGVEWPPKKGWIERLCGVEVPNRYPPRKRTKGELAMQTLLDETLTPYGIKFEVEKPIGKRFADFCVPSKHLVIEVDGEYHFYRGRQDRIRTKQINKHGYRVIRFTNHEVINDPFEVRNSLLRILIGSHAVLTS